MQIDINSINKLLIIQTAFFGDCILTSSLISLLKELNNNLVIDVLSTKSTSVIFKDNPYVHAVLEFDKRSGMSSKIVSFFSMIKKVKSNDYDVAISVQSSSTSALIMKFAGIPLRIGFSRQKFITHKVTKKQNIHMKENYNQLAQFFVNGEVKSTNSSIYISEKDRESASKFMRAHKYKVAIAPGSVWATKRWPADYFKTLINELTKRNVDVYLLGGPSELPLIPTLLDGENRNVINLIGKNSFQESCYIISQVDLLVSNDSAPLHIANGVNVPVVAIFGPTVKRFGFYPYRKNDILLETSLNCRPCGSHGSNNCKLTHHNCMREIKPELVLEKVLQLLHR